MSNKLHPIYTALDNYQYNKAIKLAAALPNSNILGKCLLTHAYYKSGQRYMAIITLDSILSGLAGPGYFFELRNDVDYAMEAIEQRNEQSAKLSVPEPTPMAASKKGKKAGKKKPTTTPKAVTSPSKASQHVDEHMLDLVDQLSTKPSLPENWEALPPPDKAIVDETTLATLSVTVNGLMLPLTIYQIYSWAATSNQATEIILRKTYCLGLGVLASPLKWTRTCQEKIESHVLSHMQTIALQWAKMYANMPGGLSTFPPMLATAWAAQTALWQLQMLPNDEKRSMILPRLAESMAMKLLQQDEIQSQSAEVQQLALRALKQQSKWEQVVDILQSTLSKHNENEDSPPAIVSDFGVAMTRTQVLKEKANALFELEMFEEAQSIYEGLLAQSPDDWSCWKGHLGCSSQHGQATSTDAFVSQIIADQSTCKYPLRGPNLMKIELQAYRLREDPNNVATLRGLSSAVQEYGEMFGSRAACTFSDLETYLDMLLTTESPGSIRIAKDILKFAEMLRKENKAPSDMGNYSNKERQARLRAYIFALKVCHKILAKHIDLQDEFLPSWEEIVTEWNSTLSLSSSNEGEESQKEIKPGDDLVLLAVQQMMYQEPTCTSSQLACAALLEAAINHSPDNAYLKMLAIYVFYLMDALPRAWKIYQSIGIKHIQLDSCAFVILPYLQEGGMYNEAATLCNSILRFHLRTARECGDYAGRAMEGGTITKANEFLEFQREKMRNSLTLLDAKGIILDCAPVLGTAVPHGNLEKDFIYKGSFGVQGVVGGEEDTARATEMVVEAHNNPFAALSVVSLANEAESIVEDSEILSDNRDLSIYFHQILWKTPTQSQVDIQRDVLRRGHIHSMLIRAALCLDAAKGLKKGKIVKTTEELAKRTNALLDGLETLTDFVKGHGLTHDNSLHDCCKALTLAAVNICKTLAVVNAGLPANVNDSLENREQRAFDLLRDAVAQLSQANTSLPDSVKSACWLLPNFIVAVYAVFCINAKILELFGWGKRKHKSKKCAESKREVALKLQEIISKMLSSLSRLPESEDAATGDLQIREEHKAILDEESLQQTMKTLVQARFHTRVRVEPILQEMDEYLDSFNVNED